LDAKPGDPYVGRGLARVMQGAYRPAVADAEEALRRHRPRTPEMLHNAACVFALAAARVHADAAEPRRDALETDYCRQAVAVLRYALLLVPPERRPAFWQEKMRPDPALDAVRGSVEFGRLDSELRKEATPAEPAGKNRTGPP